MMRHHSVDALRGIAAFSVAWFHFTQAQPLFLEDGSLLKATGVYGYLGVSAFFVISGFVVPLAMDRRGYVFPRNAADFAFRRLMRLEPTYLCSIGLALALGFISATLLPMTATMPATTAFGVALHVAYLAPWFDVPWIVPVYWSLAIEFQYYALMLFGAGALLSPRKSVVATCLLAVAILSFASSDSRILFCFLPLFGMGFAVFLMATGRLSLLEAGAAAVSFFLICCLTRSAIEAWAGLAAGLFILLPLTKPVPCLSFLGAISYSAYLIHVPVGVRIINAATRLPHRLDIQLGALALAILGTVAVAYVLWRLVERPTMLLKNNATTKSQ